MSTQSNRVRLVEQVRSIEYENQQGETLLKKVGVVQGLHDLGDEVILGDKLYVVIATAVIDDKHLVLVESQSWGGKLTYHTVSV